MLIASGDGAAGVSSLRYSPDGLSDLGLSDLSGPTELARTRTNNRGVGHRPGSAQQYTTGEASYEY